MTVELKGRAVSKQVASETGLTLLELALKHNVDFGFSCSRGTCARCRCLIVEGRDQLEEITDEEWDRLEEEEMEQGYRLACQARLNGTGPIAAVWKPYF